MNANQQGAWVSVALSVAWSLVVSVAAYAVLRAVQHGLQPTLPYAALDDPNPPAAGWSAHAGFFWRAWTVVYAGGMAGFIVKVMLRHHAALVARSLAPAIAVAAGLLLVQTVLFP